LPCQMVLRLSLITCIFFFQAEDGIRDFHVTGVQTCALPIFSSPSNLAAFKTSINPMMAFRGVLISWLILDTNSVFALDAFSALRSEERRVGKECRCRRAT